MGGAATTPSRFSGLFSRFRPVFDVFFRKSRFFLKKDLIFYRFGFENRTNRM